MPNDPQRIGLQARRRCLLGLSGAALGAAWPALAQDAAPPRPVRVLVGAAPGTVLDTVTRQIGEALTAQTGQPVVVDNRPTAGGIQALVALRDAAPDGLTLSMVNAMQLVAAPALFPRLPYDPVKDFVAVGILFSGPQVLVAHPGLPVQSWDDLLKLARAEPARLRYATSSTGSPQHVTMERVKAAANLSAQHIPYRGPAANTAVLAGEVELLLEGVAPLLPHLRAGRLRPLAIGGSQRLPVLPEVPTFEELGIPGIGPIWVGLVAPRDTPADVVARLNRTWSAAVRAPAVRTPFEAAGRIVQPGTPEAMATLVRQDEPAWRELIQKARIQVD